MTPPWRSSSKVILTPFSRRWSSAAWYSSCAIAKAWCTPPWSWGRGLIGWLRLMRTRQIAGGIEKRHCAARDSRQMPAADDLGVEAGARCDIADRDAEMSNGPDCDHWGLLG